MRRYAFLKGCAIGGLCVFLMSVFGVTVHAGTEAADTLSTVIGKKIEEKTDSIVEAKITADKYKDKARRNQTDLKRLEEADFLYGNIAFSTPDLIKTIQMLPGVNPGTELMSGLYVHGGEGSDNLFLLVQY